MAALCSHAGAGRPPTTWQQRVAANPARCAAPPPPHCPPPPVFACAQAGYRAVMLRTQYRMHPAISAFPSAFFYSGRLQDDPALLPPASGRGLAPWHAHSCFPPLAFWDCKEVQAGWDGAGSARKPPTCVRRQSTPPCCRHAGEGAEGRRRWRVAEQLGGSRGGRHVVVWCDGPMHLSLSLRPPALLCSHPHLPTLLAHSSPAPSAGAPVRGAGGHRGGADALPRAAAGAAHCLSPLGRRPIGGGGARALGVGRASRARPAHVWPPSAPPPPPKPCTQTLVQFATVDGFQGREADVVIFSCVRWVRARAGGGGGEHALLLRSTARAPCAAGAVA